MRTGAFIVSVEEKISFERCTTYYENHHNYDSSYFWRFCIKEKIQFYSSYHSQETGTFPNWFTFHKIQLNNNHLLQCLLKPAPAGHHVVQLCADEHWNVFYWIKFLENWSCAGPPVSYPDILYNKRSSNPFHQKRRNRSVKTHWKKHKTLPLAKTVSNKSTYPLWRGISVASKTCESNPRNCHPQSRLSNFPTARPQKQAIHPCTPNKRNRLDRAMSHYDSR